MQDGLIELNLNNNFGLFITLNPQTHEMQNGSIPAFLKSHFRPVACVEPDRELICAISLCSDGFTQAQVKLLEN